MTKIVLDTNLLVLLIVGLVCRGYIGKHKRLRDFSEEDFDLLRSFLAPASVIQLTPNTLTETSNLLSQINEPIRSQLFSKFRDLIGQFPESYIESRLGARQAEFARLGLTDSVLLMLSQDSSLILLTVDLDLYLAAVKRGLRAENFNHHREFNSPRH
ncbi:MAG TPA: PIN domain-containing protein [Methylocella sp.]|nr:PIN domain-containing protein [Methylocella sp.]